MAEIITAHFPAPVAVLETQVFEKEDKGLTIRGFEMACEYMNPTEQMRAFQASESIKASVTQASLSFFAEMLSDVSVTALRDSNLWKDTVKARLAGLGFQKSPGGSFAVVQSSVKYCVEHGLIDSMFIFGENEETGEFYTAVRSLRSLAESRKQHKLAAEQAALALSSPESILSKSVAKLFDGSTCDVSLVVAGLPNELCDSLIAGAINSRGSDSVFERIADRVDIAVMAETLCDHADDDELSCAFTDIVRKLGVRKAQELLASLAELDSQAATIQAAA